MPVSHCDADRSQQVDTNCADRSHRIDRDCGTGILRTGQMICHHADQRRPEHGLEEPVETPKCSHDVGIGEGGHDQIAKRGAAKTEGNHPPRLYPISQPAAKQLSQTVGDKTAGDRHAGKGLGQIQCRNQLRHHGSVVGTGDVAGKINEATQNFQWDGNAFFCDHLDVSSRRRILVPSQSSSGTMPMRSAMVGVRSRMLQESSSRPAANGPPRSEMGMVISSGMFTP